MPLGGHLLSICFAIFGRGFPVLVDEPIKHVEENHVRVLNCLGKIHKENISQGRIHRNNISSCFPVVGMSCFEALALVVGSAG
jgi:hypothetical protein